MATNGEEIRIWWIRRDLRLADNRALGAALAGAAAVVPVFVLDPVFRQPHIYSERRFAFLYEGLRALDADLRRRGARLVVRSGRPLDVLRGIAAETGAVRIHAEADYSPYARRRDRAVAAALPLALAPGLTVRHPDETCKTDGSPYRVFTPFRRRWLAGSLPRAADLETAPEAFPGAFESLPSEPIPAPELPGAPFPAGERPAHERLQAFCAGPVYQYHERRDRPDLEATSGLSPYFRFGMLSARAAAVAAREAIAAAPNAGARKAAEAWLNELIWREFFQAILYHFPHVRRTSFQDAFRDLAWADDPADFLAWKTGRTGYPFVDAAMRQLQSTGWMHNRARMVTASFLAKDLLVDWRRGERWFMQQLVDGDPAANNGGWQWSAGTGADAAPYFRIFNPVTQGERFDPGGAYIRRWVPELAAVPDRYIHAPWKMPLEVQETSNCLLGRDYPQPIVDHAWARSRALQVYRNEKAS